MLKINEAAVARTSRPCICYERTRAGRPCHALILCLIVLLSTRPARGAGTDPSPVSPATAPAPLRGMDVAGIAHILSGEPTIKASALVFISPQCPISNKYIPELNRLAASHGKDGVEIYGVISDPTVTRAAAATYQKEYKISFPILFDASGELARRLKPALTPEAFVIDHNGAVQYHGRIDDLMVDLRKQRDAATHHEMTDAIIAVAAGKTPAVASAPAVGCFFEAWGANAGPVKVTYARDIAPLLNANCVQCHRAGEIGPFPLTGYDDAAKHAKQMAKVTDEHLMPPWKAEPGFGHFADERRLSDGEVELIAAWSKAGAPKGDDADLPPAPKFTSDWALGKPDIELKMSAAFTVPAAGRDVYRVFAMPLDIPADKYVSGFEFKPGATTVVHHALLFLDDSGQARKMAGAATDGKPGYQSFGGLGFTPSGGLGGWAPGATPYFLPDGVGRPVHKGADVVLQVHYHPDGKERQDQSRIAIYFAKKPVEKVTMSWPLANRSIDIPAGDAHYVRNATITAPVDVTLLGVTPHMHLVGKQMKVTATKPDGTVVPLIWVKDWDFRWQDQYRFVEPVKLPRGTVVSLEAIYDNSAANTDNPNTPPLRVTRGEQTTNEMCICFLQLTVDQQPPPGAAGAAAGRVGLLRSLLGGNTNNRNGQ